MSSDINEIILEARSQGHTNLYLNYQHLGELPPGLLELKKTEKLYLKYNILTKLPADIWKLESLVELYLHSNNLQELPEEIGQLECLESLNVSHNYLKTLPVSISQLRHLRYLHLANNQLAVLPKEVGNLYQLRVLDVMNNNLEWLPWQLCLCSYLETLSFDGNKTEWIPRQLTNLKHLKELSGSRNKLKSLPQDLDQLVSLESLLLDSNSHLHALPATLLRMSCLNILGLNRCHQQMGNGKSGSEGYFCGVQFVGRIGHCVLPLLELSLRAANKAARSQPSSDLWIRRIPVNLDSMLRSPLGHCYRCGEAFFMGLFLFVVDAKTAVTIVQRTSNGNLNRVRGVELEFVFAACTLKCLKALEISY